METFTDPFYRLSNGICNIGFYHRVRTQSGITAELFPEEFALHTAYPSAELKDRIELSPWVECDDKACLDAVKAVLKRLMVHPAPGSSAWRYPLENSGVHLNLTNVWVIEDPQELETFQTEVAAFIDGGSPMTYTLTSGDFQGVELRFKRYQVPAS